MRVIVLSNSDIEEVLAISSKRAEKYKDQHGHYGNEFAKHFVGTLGELASEKYFARLFPDISGAFRNPESDPLCDLLLPLPEQPLRIEIKTWSERWEELGRCITPGQLPWVKDKADIVMWCLAEYESVKLPEQVVIEPVRVILKGYSTIEDLSKMKRGPTGPPFAPPRDNYQLASSDMRTMDELDSHISKLSSRC